MTDRYLGAAGLVAWVRALPRLWRLALVVVLVAVVYVGLVFVPAAGNGEVDWWRPLPSMIGPVCGVALARWLFWRRTAGR